MSTTKLRQDIVEIGRRIYARGFVASNDGNLSVRVSPNRILITPTGVSKGFLSPDDIILCDMEGRKVEGESEPSSEIKLHLEVYLKRPDIFAVVHAHPPYATAFAVVGLPLTECILPEVVISIGRIPLAPYATPSTAELAGTVSPYLPRHNALLLSNHGTLTIGEDIYEAYYLLERVEHLARVSLLARQLGEPRKLSEEELSALAEINPQMTYEALNGSRCANCGVCGKPVEGDSAESASVETSDLVRQITEEILKRIDR